MKEIEITYDGRVYVSNHSFDLGGISVASIVHSALGFDKEAYQDINAEVTIIVNRKPDVPRILVTGSDEEC